MAQRRFGPTRGAGVATVEKEGEKSIEPSALGWAAYAGIMEKGAVGELIIAGDKTTFTKKCGGIIDDSLLPDCAQDYYDLANGAGGLLLVRVTDGNEAQAILNLYARIGATKTAMGQLKAANGGRWGGKELRVTYDLDDAGDLSNTTLQLPAAAASSLKTDELKGGWIQLNAVANTSYPIVGNTSSGLITVASDQTMKDDWTAAAAPGDLRFYAYLENEGKELTAVIGEGEDNPDTEFSITVYVDGDFVKKYGNLHTDPTHARYWVNIINNDDGNDEIFAVDSWTGAHVAAVRPANIYGLSEGTGGITATVLTAVIHEFLITSPTGGNPTIALGTTTDADVEQVITITMTSATAGDIVSDKFGALGSVTLGTLFDPHNAAGGAVSNKWAPPFTVTAGATPLVAADTLKITYKPFVADQLIGGYVYPDKAGAKRDLFRIIDNTHKTITVTAGSDMTTVATDGDEFMVVFAQPFAGGRDGNADVVDANYSSQAWDTGTSPFNQVAGKNLGLLKFATPGITSTAVQKAGAAYAEAKNHEYRYEVPSATVTENGALDLVNDTLGRNDFVVVSFPSYASVPHPDPVSAREGKLKSVPMTGMIHGREARMAADYKGYHRAAAGDQAKLPRVLKLPTGDKKLNEELLNPAGISVIKKLKGNFVIWGDRICMVDPTWRWKHQREQMSYYEHVLQENFDWIVFTINDPDTDADAATALLSFFLPEWTKRAIRGNTVQEAAIIKVDSEINTDATRAAGDKYAEIKLRLADVTERFIITIGKQGIFEQVG